MLQVVSCVVVLFFFISVFFHPQYKALNTAEGYVISISAKKNYQQITVIDGLSKYLIYDFNNKDVKYGDYLIIEGKEYQFDPLNYVGEFDYQKYLLSINIRSCLIADTIIIQDSRFDCRNLFLELNKYLSAKIDEKSYQYISMLIFGYKDKESESYKLYSDLNITYLLVISGMHISILIKLCQKFLTFIDDPFKKWFLISFILIFYAYLLEFNYSVVRAVLLYILYELSRFLRISFTKLDIISILFTIFFLKNYYIMLNMSFILSYFVSMILILLSNQEKKLSDTENSLIINIILLPILINLSGKINILPLLFVQVISSIFNFIFILTLITFIIPKLYHLLSLVIEIYEFFLNLLNINFLDFKMPYFSLFKGLIYYAMLIFLFYFTKKHFWKKLFFLILIFNIRLPKNYIEFISCGQGDSSIIMLDSKVLVVDCFNNTTDVLKKKGIRKIDYLILSHGHYDHIGDSYSIIDNFKVTKLMYPKYDDTELLNEVKMYASKNKIELVPLEYSMVISIETFSLHILNPIEKQESENDNSLVFLLKYRNYQVLYTGDIEDESLIIPYLNCIDILKVSHHGSSSSTSKKFVEKTQPKVAIISCGYLNKYHFPSDATLENLQKSIVYITYESGNICVNLQKKKLKIDTYRAKNGII